MSDLALGTIRRRISQGIRGSKLLQKSITAHYDVGDGRKLTVPEIANKTGLSGQSVRNRIKSGKKGSELLRTTHQLITQQTPRYDVGDGRLLTAKEIADIVGLTAESIVRRIRRGTTGADLLKSKQQLFKDHHRSEYPVTYDLGNSERLTITEISAKYHLSTDLIYLRINQRKTGPDLIKPAQKQNQRICFSDGRKLTINQIAAIVQVSPTTIRQRIKANWPTDDLLLPAQQRYSRQHYSSQN